MGKQIRVKVWYIPHGSTTDGSNKSGVNVVVRFDSSINFNALKLKIVNKVLGKTTSSGQRRVVDPEMWELRLVSISDDDEVDDGTDKATFRLDDTDEIDHDDVLILKRRRGAAADVVKIEESSSTDRANVKSEDDDDSDESSIEDVTEQYLKEKANVRRDDDDEDDDDDSDDSDDSSIEDVTEQYLQEKRKQQQNEAVDITQSTGNDDDEDSNTNKEEKESDEEDDDDDGEEDYRDEKEDAKPTATGQKRGRARKPIEPPLQVLMDEKDVPAAPGKAIGDDADKEDSASSPGDMEETSMINGGADQEVKSRIIKLLNMGFHDQSNEHEARNAMKLAQRLMHKHDLSQAIMMQERDAIEKKAKSGVADNEILKGGLVKVRIVYRKTGKPAQHARWISDLSLPVRKNFDVKAYTQVMRGRRCNYVFYGIYTNAQWAAYAFRVAVERISQMAAEYEPAQKRRSSSGTRPTAAETKSARLSYAIGVVRGIDKEVDATLKREKERRLRKLERARNAVSTGEAYEESDDEDDSVDGAGFSFPDTKPSSARASTRPVVSTTAPPATDTAGSSNETAAAEAPAGETPVAAAAASTQHALSGESLDRRIEELEREEQAALVLVDHREKVADRVLKDKGIKLSAGRRRKSINFDWDSYQQGIEDSKEIDISQRALRDEVKVKKEKREGS